MLPIFQRGPAFGIEITAQQVRTAAVGRGRGENGPAVGCADLPAGAAAGDYAERTIDAVAVNRALLVALAGSDPKGGRAALCLSDAVFRIQTLDFDELPARPADQLRLVRWRLEKSAAFDLADTLLQHQVLRRPGSITVLVCAAKRTVIEQYEAVLAGAGLEAWSIVPSSFALVNFYAPVLSQRSRSYAFLQVTGDATTTLVMEQGSAGFYRFKEIKRGAAAEVCGRLARDISDSLHFYTHRDRSRQVDLQHVYLSGDAALCGTLAQELGAAEQAAVQVLSPGMVLPGNGMGGEFAAAAGAGLTL